MRAELIVPRERLERPVALHAYDELVGPVFIRLAYYYDHAPDEDALRTSLVALLDRYPIFAGRMRKDAEGRLEVGFHERAGARFEVRTLRSNGPGRGPDAIRDASRYFPPNPLRLTAPSTPLLLARLTRFADGSGVLGIGLSHALVDGEADSQVVDDWARLARGEAIGPSDGVSHDRRSLERLVHARGEASVEATQYRRLSKLEFARAQGSLVVGVMRASSELFDVSAGDLEALHEHGRVRADGFVSPLDVLTAGLMRVLAPVRAKETLPFSLIVDFRRQLAGSIPDGLLANLCCGPTASIAARDIEEAPLGMLARNVRATIASVDADAIARDLALLKAQRVAPVGRLWPRSVDILRRSGLMFDSWSKQRMYEADFGTGCPFWVELPAMLPEGLGLFLPTPARDGSLMIRVNVAGASRRLLRTRLPGDTPRERGLRLVELLRATP